MSTTLARQQLIPDEADAAWQQGSTMSLDEAVELAQELLATAESK